MEGAMSDDNNNKDLSMEAEKASSSHSDHCDKCHADFEDFDQFVGHKCPSSPFLCSVCSENFDFDYQLNIHMKTAHDSDTGGSKTLDHQKIDCEVCKSSSFRRQSGSNSSSEIEDNYGDNDEDNDSLLGRDSKMDYDKGEDTGRHAMKRKAVKKNLENEKLSKPRKRRRGGSESDSAKEVVTERKQQGENANTNSLNDSRKNASLATLTSALPDNECAVLLQPQQPTNNFKCAKCHKTFRSYKLAATHYTNCKCNRLKKNTLAFDEIRWVCTYCNSLFVAMFDFLKHKRICSNSSVQIGSLKRNLLATVKESLSKSYVPFNKGCLECYHSSNALCQNEACQKLLQYMKSCTVCIRKLPVIDVQSGAYLYECRDCKVVFTNNGLYLKHMEGLHNSSSSTVPQGKPLFLPPSLKAVRSIKKETPPAPAVASEPPPLSDEPLRVNDPFARELLKLIASNLSKQDEEQPQPGTSSQSRLPFPLDNYSIMNMLICSCNPKKWSSPCMDCISAHEDVPEVPQEFIQFMNGGNASSSTLTPPVSHTGFTPPSTPDAKRSSETETAFEPACSPICEEGGKTVSDEEECMDEIQVDPDPEQEKVKQVQESREREIPPPDPAEEPPPPETCMEIVHAEHDADVDAYAYVSPSDPDHVLEYICLCCVDSHDAVSLSKHFRKNAPQDVIKALYVVKHDKK